MRGPRWQAEVDVLGLFDNALVQAASYGIAVLGVVLALRVLRYPDLTADGSFLLGATAFAGALTAGTGWPVAALAAVAAGCLAGLATAAIHTLVRVNKLLSGILTSMVCYSLAFRILSGRPNVSILDYRTPYAAASDADRVGRFIELGLHPLSLGLGLLVLGVVCAGVWMLLRSEFGLVLRATGSRPSLVERAGRRPARYVTVGLAVANGLVGLAGAAVTARQGFVDVNMGVGVIIVLIAALVLGEETLRHVWRRVGTSAIGGRVAAAVFGTLLYYLLYLGILRASLAGILPIDIRPTDLKMLSAAMVVAVILVRVRSQNIEEDPLSF